MKIKWLGHASFLITAQDGTRIITDPYGKFDGLNYAPINESADVVTASHKHGDHFGGKVKGKPRVIDQPGTTTVKGISFTGIACYHDPSGGKERGNNIIFCFSVDGIRLCHLGDLGHLLSKEQIAQIGPVDILLIPVGGFYTINAAEAGRIAEQIKPRVIIPMHVSNKKCAFPIAGVEEFLKGKSNVKRTGASEAEFRKENLPAKTEIIVLEPAL